MRGTLTESGVALLRLEFRMYDRLLESLPKTSAIATVLVCCLVSVYRLIRFSLEDSPQQGVSMRRVWERFRLAVACVALFLGAVLVIVLVIKSLTNEHAQHADTDHNTADQPDRTAAKDRLIKLKLTSEQHGRTAPGDRPPAPWSIRKIRLRRVGARRFLWQR